MNNIIDYIPNQENYKNLTPFEVTLIQNFPFLTDDFDSLTNVGFLNKVIESLNDVIANENAVENNVTNLYNAFVNLQNYINDYFNNLDVQDEINNKLDDMARDGSLTNLISAYLDPIIDSQNEQIANINSKVNSVAEGSPLVASSTSGMTNTSRIYVNTTDGNWYYYNGSEWVVGGIYQATKLAENSVEYTNFSVNTQGLLKIDKNNDIVKFRQGSINPVNGSDQNLTSTANVSSLTYFIADLIHIKPSNGLYYVLYKYNKDTLQFIEVISRSNQEAIINTENQKYMYRVVLSTKNYDSIDVSFAENIEIELINHKNNTQYENLGDDLIRILNINSSKFDNFQFGNLNQISGGNQGTSTKAIRTVGYINEDVIILNPNYEYVYLIFEYNADNTFISHSPARASYHKIINSNNHKYRIEFRKYNGEDLTLEDFKDIANVLLIKKDSSQKINKFENQVLNIANSGMNLQANNSVEHFLMMVKFGFNTLKGDMRLTSDNKIIMCHDAGFTLDANGKITSYDNNNKVLIHDMTYVECMELSYSAFSTYGGREATVCDFDTYIRICKTYNCTPYITIRNEYIEDTVTEMLRVLDKYGMRYDCIMNNYPSINTANYINSVDKNIYQAIVLENGATPTINDVEKCISLNNAMLCFFLGNDINVNVDNVLEYAHSKGIRVLNGQISQYQSYLNQIKKGITGFHIVRPIMQYEVKKYNFRIYCNNNEASMSTMYNFTQYDADISVANNQITIGNIKAIGDINDNFGIPKLWLKNIPCNLIVKNNNKEIVDSYIDTNGNIVINTNTQVAQYYIVSIEI